MRDLKKTVIINRTVQYHEMKQKIGEILGCLLISERGGSQ